MQREDVLHGLHAVHAERAVPLQLLALRDESSLMLVNRAPNDTDTAGPSPQAQPALASSEIVAVKAAAGAGTPASQSSDG